VLHKRAAVAACVTAALLAPATPAAAAAGDPACEVAYAMDTDAAGFTARITITNVGTGPLYGWTFKFKLPAGQSLQYGWNAVFSEQDGEVTAHNLKYNRDVYPGKAAYPQFRGTGTDLVSKPDAFTVNGLACTTAGDGAAVQ
jgi:acetylxylan esterase